MTTTADQSYADSLNKSVKREYLKCFACNKPCPKSWIIINNDGILKNTDTVKYPNELHYCSTNCYLGHKENILPYNSWDYLKNKEDFNDPVPVLPKKKKEFIYLSFVEIRNLSDKERQEYYEQMEEYMSYSLESCIYMEEYEEDKRTYEIENNFDNDYTSSEDCEEYY